MTKKLYQSDPIFTCWRIAAIHRCVVAYGKDRAWALEKVREADASGNRDHIVGLWFNNIAAIRERHTARQRELRTLRPVMERLPLFDPSEVNDRSRDLQDVAA